MNDVDELRTRLRRALGAEYDVMQSLGQGGAGVVFLARDLSLKRNLAIKVLSPIFSSGTGAIERFVNEGEAIARLTHPNVVQVYFVGRTGDLLYIAMQYVDGGTLAQRMESRGPLPVSDVLRIIRDIATGLSQAHQRGIIHRDLKPQNILIEAESDRCLIADFGVARLDDATLTETGMVCGTPVYLAPEQVLGGAIDKRVDIYALGLLAYEMLKGDRPFDAPTPMAAMLLRLAQDPPPIRQFRPDVPKWFAEVIDRCLARESAERFVDMQSLLSALDRAETGVLVNRPPTQRRRWVRWTLAASAVVVVAVVVGVGSREWRLPWLGTVTQEAPQSAASASATDDVLRLARTAYYAGEYDVSLERFQSVASNSHIDSGRRKEAFRYLARTYVALGRNDEAKGMLREMAALAPPLAILIPSLESDVLMRLYQDVLVERSTQNAEDLDSEPVTAIAVYPFQSLTDDSTLAGLREGLPIILNNALAEAEIPGLMLVVRQGFFSNIDDSGDSSFYVVDDVLKAGIRQENAQGHSVQPIRASHLAFGSYAVRNGELLLTAWLVNVKTGSFSHGIQVLGKQEKVLNACNRLGSRLVDVVRDRAPKQQAP